MAKKEEDSNYTQQIFYAVFTKYLPEWGDVIKFSKRTGININTLRDIYYKGGQAGISTMDRVLKALLDLTPSKVGSVIEMINRQPPVTEANRIWYSIKAPPEKLKYYALCAKAIWEIEEEIEKSK